MVISLLHWSWDISLGRNQLNLQKKKLDWILGKAFCLLGELGGGTDSLG